MLDAGFASGVGIGLLVEEDGDNLVAEALTGEAADLEISFGEGGILFQKPFGEMVMNQVDQRDEIVPLMLFEIEIDGGGGDLFGEREGGDIDLVLF